MVFLHSYEHFRTWFLMHIFAYFGPLVHICISVHILGNFAYFVHISAFFDKFLAIFRAYFVGPYLLFLKEK